MPYGENEGLKSREIHEFSERAKSSYVPVLKPTQLSLFWWNKSPHIVCSYVLVSIFVTNALWEVCNYIMQCNIVFHEKAFIEAYWIRKLHRGYRTVTSGNLKIHDLGLGENLKSVWPFKHSIWRINNVRVIIMKPTHSQPWIDW